MQGYILRRRKLGRTSVKEIRKFSKNIVRRVLDKKMDDQNLLCIRWGYTQNVPQEKVLNTAEAIHQVNDKKAFRLLLSSKDLAPKTWATLAEYTKLNNAAKEIPLHPLVVRPAVHAQGKHCYKCATYQELRQAVDKCGANYYISEFVDKVAEYRVFVCQGRAVWVAKKTPGNPDDVAWNVARGGRFDNVAWGDWDCKMVKTAILAFNESKLDFGGVDVMVDKDGKCYVLEINSAPSQTSPYRQECVAKVFDYILERNGAKERIPLSEKKGLYLKFIHPAIDEKAY